MQLKFSDTKAVPIKQIAVRLKHPEYSVATNLVNAVYDGNTNLYKAVVDVGDPVNIMLIFFCIIVYRIMLWLIMAYIKLNLSLLMSFY